MNKGLIAILILVVSGLTYPFFIEPLQAETGLLRGDVSEIRETLKKVDEFVVIRDRLAQQSGQFTEEELSKLDQILPDRVDVARRILDLNTVAEKNGLSIDGGVSVSRVAAQTNPLGGENIGFAPVVFTLNLIGPYEGMLSFLEDLSESLTLFDVDGISFSAPGKESGRLFNFNLKLVTYELTSGNN